MIRKETVIIEHVSFLEKCGDKIGISDNEKYDLFRFRQDEK